MALKHALKAGLATLTLALSTGATLAYFEESLPSTMNPLFASSMVDRRSQELVFDRLWYHDAVNNELKSRVVEKWELADGGKGLKITLKQGIKWHNGKPLTSKDVCFTVDAMLDPKTPSPLATEYREVLAEGGMTFSGVSPDGQLVEIIELPDHPFFVATQFHPELKSRPSRPHPLFAAFVAAAGERHRARTQQKADAPEPAAETVPIGG